MISSGTTYSLSNIHGDIMATVDADGNIKGIYMTGPFGEVLDNTLDQTTPDNSTDTTTMSYVGKHMKVTESDLSIGAIQMGARVYIPELGRFLQIDPVDGGTLNVYVYAMDPVNQFDLSGKFSIKFLIQIVNITAVGIANVVRSLIDAKNNPISKPSAMGGYKHWLNGGGDPVTFDASEIHWRITEIKKAPSNAADCTCPCRVLSVKNWEVNAQAGRLDDAFFNIGNVDGKFSGFIYRVRDKLYMNGRLEVSPNEYDFAGGDAFIAGIGAAIFNGGHYTNYTMNFINSGEIFNQALPR